MKIFTFFVFIFVFVFTVSFYLYPRLRVNREVSGIFGLRNFSETDWNSLFLALSCKNLLITKLFSKRRIIVGQSRNIISIIQIYTFHKTLRVMDIFSRNVKIVPVSSCCSYTVLIPVKGALTYKMILNKIGSLICIMIIFF